MKQQTFAAADFERYRKPTRRQQFLAEMDKVVPWDQLCALIEPYYPKAGNGRPPVGLERMPEVSVSEFQGSDLHNPLRSTAIHSNEGCYFGLKWQFRPQ